MTSPWKGSACFSSSNGPCVCAVVFPDEVLGPGLLQTNRLWEAQPFCMLSAPRVSHWLHEHGAFWSRICCFDVCIKCWDPGASASWKYWRPCKRSGWQVLLLNGFKTPNRNILFSSACKHTLYGTKINMKGFAV